MENGNTRLNLSVMIRVPVKLGKMDIWSDMKALSVKDVVLAVTVVGNYSLSQV